MQKTDDTLDPAVEARLEKCRKLLVRDPATRKKAWIKLIVSTAVLLSLLGSLWLLKNFILSALDFSNEFTYSMFLSSLMSYPAIFWYFGSIIPGLIYMIPAGFNLSADQKITNAVDREHRKFIASNQVNETDIFTQQQRWMIKKSATLNVILFAVFWFFTGITILVTVDLWNTCKSGSNLFKMADIYPYTLPDQTMQFLRICVSCIEFFYGAAVTLSCFGICYSLLDLFFYKRTTLWEQLLMKLRELNSQPQTAPAAAEPGNPEAQI